MSTTDQPVPSDDRTAFQFECRRFGITPLHWTMLTAVAYQSVPRAVLIHNTIMRRQEPTTTDECENVLVDCIAQKWLRQLDEEALSEIDRGLDGVFVACETEGLPQIDDIDFTPDGANMYKSLLATASPESRRRLHQPCLRLVHQSGSEWKVACYLVDICPVNEVLVQVGGNLAAELAERSIQSVAQPVEIGPWCSHWWNIHPKGYLVEASFAL